MKDTGILVSASDLGSRGHDDSRMKARARERMALRRPKIWGLINPNQRSSRWGIGVNIEGREYDIPSIFGGKVRSIDESINIMHKNKMVDPETGLHSSSYATPEEATRASKRRSRRLD